jgi:hypothetical protein
MLWRSHEIIIETTELSVEGQEVVKGERFIGIKDEMQRHIMVHGGHEAVGAGRPHEVVAVGEGAEVFGWIAFGKDEVHRC